MEIHFRKPRKLKFNETFIPFSDANKENRNSNPFFINVFHEHINLKKLTTLN